MLQVELPTPPSRSWLASARPRVGAVRGGWPNAVGRGVEDAESLTWWMESAGRSSSTWRRARNRGMDKWCRHPTLYSLVGPNLPTELHRPCSCSQTHHTASEWTRSSLGQKVNKRVKHPAIAGPNEETVTRKDPRVCYSFDVFCTDPHQCWAWVLPFVSHNEVQSFRRHCTWWSPSRPGRSPAGSEVVSESEPKGVCLRWPLRVSNMSRKRPDRFVWTPTTMPSIALKTIRHSNSV